MPLFTDGTASEIGDLRAYDAAIAEVAAAEGVELKAKLEVAMQEIGLEIEEFLARSTAGTWGLPNVVVTPALKQWHTLHTLALIYGDIHQSHVNRRFEQKWKEYKLRARWAAETLFRVGVGLVAAPVPKAPVPEVRITPGDLAAGTYAIRTAWVNSAGEAGAASDAAIVAVESPAAIVVRPLNPPPVATGYHVYAGFSSDQVSRQTGAPAGANEEWTLSGALRGGPAAPTGQQPHRYVRNERILQRG
jgi:hypothetical protein